MSTGLLHRLQDCEPFQRLSEEAKEKIRLGAELVRFDIGQQVVSPDTVPARVVVVLDGQARCLEKDLGRLITLKKLGCGAVLGAASLMCCRPIENIISSEGLTGVSIPEDLWMELHGTEDSFRQWCDGRLWKQELVALLHDINQEAGSSVLSIRGNLSLLEAKAIRVFPDAESIQEAQGSGFAVFVASTWSGLQPGRRLDQNEDVPQGAPFPTRLIGVPDVVLNSLLAAVEEEPSRNGQLTRDVAASEVPAVNKVVEAPPVSRFDPNSDVLGQIELIEAEGPLDETLACIQMLARLFALPTRKDSIEKVLRETLRRGQKPTLQLCGQIAAGLGLHVSATRVHPSLGTRLRTPSMIPWGESFAVVGRSNARGLTLLSPKHGTVSIEPGELEERFPEGIELLLFDRTSSTPNETFGPRWFLPAIQRYRTVLLQVLIASFVVQLFALANPLLIQVVIDKVISQRSLNTLQVLGIALVAVTLLEGLLGSLKTFLFTGTTNRIDQRLGAEVIDHLLRLPLSYFDRRPVGELGSRIGELEKIREFLTGQALSTLIDACFSVIYILVMVFYSWMLTLIALAVLPIQVGLTLIGAPLFRRQFRQAAESNAKTQSHLVEVLTGIQTVKSQNVEMMSRRSWQELYSKYVSNSFDKTISGTVLSQTSQVLQKLSQLMVLWVGATLVLDGDLTLGQLIAFRIISSYVTQPLLRLSTIWQNIQELKVSFERLADVIDTPQESSDSDKAKVPLPPIDGLVRFEDVSFRFQVGSPYVLKHVSLEVPAGTFIGIVGQSGSGKSTLMKLLPRLYAPDEGKILIDGYDIDKVELYSLRRQIGIVPQDPLLFSGTISENIALTQPDASSDEIIRAAKLADAHDFIMGLPSGYSTPVGERGASLSGGQRQRIAVARTLLSNPKLMVLDEATSALDYETERRVADNLLGALANCTVFFVTHRLSTVRRADLICVMHKGEVEEVGKHNELMQMRGRYYALYSQQEAE